MATRLVFLEALGAGPRRSARHPLLRSTSAQTTLLRNWTAPEAICTAQGALRVDARRHVLRAGAVSSETQASNASCETHWPD